MNERQEGAKMKLAGAEGLLCTSSHARFEFSSPFCVSSSKIKLSHTSAAGVQLQPKLKCNLLQTIFKTRAPAQAELTVPRCSPQQFT